MSNLLIPVDYWLGNRTIELEIPWLTPESIHMLELFCKPQHNVLEFGSGGSTLFFARRANLVTSIEPDLDWNRRVTMELVARGIKNVDMCHLPDVESCRKVLTSREAKYDIILVDCDGINRWGAAKLALDFVNKSGVIVVDNYDAVYCRNLDVLFSGKLQTAYDDPHWVGRGTKVYYC